MKRTFNFTQRQQIERQDVSIVLVEGGAGGNLMQSSGSVTTGFPVMPGFW